MRLTRSLPRTVLLAASAAATLAAGCDSGTTSSNADMAQVASGPATPVEGVSLGQTISDPHLSAPVDVVRDEHGIPHIYGQTLVDVSFAQGYVMAQDRMVQLDLARHQADGTLAELLGEIAPSVIGSDMQWRTHHLRPTAEHIYAELKASTTATDKNIVALLDNFAAGVNLYVAQLQAGDYTQPVALNFLYVPKAIKPWTAVDSLLLGQLQAFELSFDSGADIVRTALAAADKSIFAGATDPELKARAGFSADLEDYTPLDKTHTIAGWTGMSGDTSTAMQGDLDLDGNLLALASADLPSLHDIGLDKRVHPERGSNNWVIGPKLSATGHPLVANDTHLSLGNPATFYLVHLVAAKEAKPLDVMGVQFPGIPGVILGMNQHVAWGGTVNYIDVTDVYEETVGPCGGGVQGTCVTWKGTQVPLTARKETINIGKYGTISSHIDLTYYEVPHHGPIIPRVAKNQRSFEPLGATELSIRWTGYEGAQLFRAIYNLDSAQTVAEAKAALDADFKYGGQNWVIGDDQGNFGWTQTIRVPRRAAGFPPNHVLPGDGRAEWGADMDPKYIPHAWNPDQGYLATANADPIGVTDDGDPWNEPMVDGAPLYLGSDYDPGTRVGRITKRIEALKTAGKKIAVDDMQSIQADAITEWGQALQPTLVDTAQALVEEFTTPGTHADLKDVATSATAFDRAFIGNAVSALKAWTYDTPAGTEFATQTPQTMADSIATLVFAAWEGRFAQGALGDEIGQVGHDLGSTNTARLLVRMCTAPDKLKTGVRKNGDSVLFDDLTTPLSIETKRQVSARALVDAVDYLVKTLGPDASKWSWGALHTLTLAFPAGIDALNIPTSKEYPNGFPRHGSTGTVDVGDWGLSTTDFTYAEGPAIRFVCDLDPSGPKAKNALPGGEAFDPNSSHYSDQWALWQKNQTFDLAFQDADVIKSANAEVAARKALADASMDKDGNRPAGRVRFQAPAK